MASTVTVVFDGVEHFIPVEILKYARCSLVDKADFDAMEIPVTEKDYTDAVEYMTALTALNEAYYEATRMGVRTDENFHKILDSSHRVMNVCRITKNKLIEYIQPRETSVNGLLAETTDIQFLLQFMEFLLANQRPSLAVVCMDIILEIASTRWFIEKHIYWVSRMMQVIADFKAYKMLKKRLTPPKHDGALWYTHVPTDTLRKTCMTDTFMIMMDDYMRTTGDGRMVTFLINWFSSIKRDRFHDHYCPYDTEDEYDYYYSHRHWRSKLRTHLHDAVQYPIGEEPIHPRYGATVVRLLKRLNVTEWRKVPAQFMYEYLIEQRDRTVVAASVPPPAKRRSIRVEADAEPAKRPRSLKLPFGDGDDVALADLFSAITMEQRIELLPLIVRDCDKKPQVNGELIARIASVLPEELRYSLWPLIRVQFEKRTGLELTHLCVALPADMCETFGLYQRLRTLLRNETNKKCAETCMGVLREHVAVMERVIDSSMGRVVSG
jgi:hypothetical protein